MTRRITNIGAVVEYIIAATMDTLTLAGSVPSLTVDAQPPPTVTLDTLTLAGSVISLSVTTLKNIAGTFIKILRKP